MLNITINSTNHHKITRDLVPKLLDLLLKLILTKLPKPKKDQELFLNCTPSSRQWK